jgi:hypothetical protein
MTAAADLDTRRDLLASSAMSSGALSREQVKVGLGRSNAVVTVAMLAFLGLIVGYAAFGAANASDSSARILGFGFAGLFGIPLVMLLFALPRFLSPRYVILDATGLHIQHGREKVTVAWPDVVAVGFGYEHPDDKKFELPTSLEDAKDMVTGKSLVVGYLSDKAAEALQVSGKRRIALEIYPARLDAVHHIPKLAAYWTALAPPVEGVPSVGWRFPLPPVVAIAKEIDHGVHAFQPERRLGWYPRPWSGK